MVTNNCAIKCSAAAALSHLRHPWSWIWAVIECRVNSEFCVPASGYRVLGSLLMRLDSRVLSIDCAIDATTMPVKTIQVSENVLHANWEIARQNRARLDATGIVALNLMASPGAGKTSLIEQTIHGLQNRLRIGMINSDTSPAAMDAERAERAGAAAVHMNTAGKCHLDAGMVRDAIACLPLREIDLVLIENIGNLVCPASWQLGSHWNVLIASTPEGDDKPYKYPRMYGGVDALVINKTDLLPYVSFDVDYFTRGVEALNCGLLTFPLSCRSTEGLDRWVDWVAAIVGGRDREGERSALAT